MKTFETLETFLKLNQILENLMNNVEITEYYRRKTFIWLFKAVVANSNSNYVYQVTFQKGHAFINK